MTVAFLDQVELTKVSVSLDNNAVFVGKYLLNSPFTSKTYSVPPFRDFITLTPDRILLVEEQSGDLLDLNLETMTGQRIKGRGKLRSRQD